MHNSNVEAEVIIVSRTLLELKSKVEVAIRTSKHCLHYVMLALLIAAFRISATRHLQKMSPG